MSCRSIARALSNRNVWLQVLYSALSSGASSVSQGPFLSNYIRLLGLSPEDLGFIFATSGIVNLVLAWPFGWATDKLPRQTFLRAGVAFALLQGLAAAAALQLRSKPLLFASAALVGVANACTGPALSASFADSVPTGERTLAFTLLYTSALAAGGLGPLAAAAFFWRQGNDWSLGVVVPLMQVGNALGMAASLLLLLVRDARALGGESEGVLAGGGSAEGEGEAGGGEDLEASLLSRAADAAADAPSTARRLGLGHQELRLCGCCTLTVAHIPYLLFSSDFIISIGAGMTVAYFPLFFSQAEGLSPVALSLLFAAVPALIAVVGLLLVPLSRRCGRAPAALLANVVGTGCLFSLWLALRLPVPVVCLMYLVRSGAMNGSAAVQRGLLMDVVPKKMRGRWSAMEALTGFTWTGSAVLGGWLINATGSYTWSFFYTAVIYSGALLVFLPLLPLTRGERVDAGEGGAKAEEAKEPDGPINT